MQTLGEKKLFEHVFYLLPNNKLSFSFHFGRLRSFWIELYSCRFIGVRARVFHDGRTQRKREKKKIEIHLSSASAVTWNKRVPNEIKINYRQIKITITALCGLSDAIIGIITTIAYFWATPRNTHTALSSSHFSRSLSLPVATTTGHCRCAYFAHYFSILKAYNGICACPHPSKAISQN